MSFMFLGDLPKTKAGNLKEPSLFDICTWICRAWAKVSVDIITKSFKICGISSAVDGSEDRMIDCFMS